jgi:putative component of membrane protein insertase Oxa1/YidC/SpoIIIJ protein YidD
MRNLLRHTWHLPRNAIALLITGYQRTISPDHGPLRGLYTYGYCRHEPSCSVYSKDVILRQGIIRGGLKSLWRVLSCHPWAKLSDAKIMKIAHKG